MSHTVALNGSSYINSSSPPPPSSLSTTTASILQIKALPHRNWRVAHRIQDLNASASLFTSGSSPFIHLQLPCRTAITPLYGPVRASFILTLIGGVIKFIIRVPGKAFLEKIENDIDKLAKSIKTGASIVTKVADEVEDFADRVKSAAERAEQLAEKVLEVTNKVEEEIDEAIDFLEGETKDTSSNVTLEDKNVVS